MRSQNVSLIIAFALHFSHIDYELIKKKRIGQVLPVFFIVIEGPHNTQTY